jgi:ABC-type multidrug transport system fused ATPase/permease subunit
MSVCLGCLSAVPTILLVANLGLLVDLVRSRHASGQVSWTWPLASWLDNLGVSWPWADRYDYWLLTLLGSLVTLALVEWALLLLYFRNVHLAALDTSIRLLTAVYEQSRRLDAPDWFADSQPPTEHRLVEACGRLRDGLSQWWMTVPRAISVIALLLLLSLSINFFLTLLALLLAIFLWRSYLRIQVRIAAKADRYRSLIETRESQWLEGFRAAQTVAGFGGQIPENQSLRDASVRYRREAARAAICTSSLRPWLLLLLACGAAILVLVVGLSPSQNLAGTTILILAVLRMAPAALRLRNELDRIPKSETVAREVFAYLDETPAVGQMAGAAALASVAREIRWENVTFTGNSETPLLDDVSLTVPAGTLAAFLSLDCGTPPALANLCLRYADPGTGRILLDGADVRSVTLESLRRQVVVAAADGTLFTGTIEDNIRSGRSGYTTQHIEVSAKTCHLLDPIQNLPQ